MDDGTNSMFQNFETVQRDFTEAEAGFFHGLICEKLAWSQEVCSGPSPRVAGAQGQENPLGKLKRQAQLRGDILKINPSQRMGAAARRAVAYAKPAPEPAECKMFWVDGSYSMDGWAGCAVVYKENSAWKGQSFTLGRLASACEAELHAIAEAVTIAHRQDCEPCTTLIVYCDS
jgi:hypothetical protein